MKSQNPEVHRWITNYGQTLPCLLLAFTLFFNFSPRMNAQNYTRGIGIFPGNIQEDFSPIMTIDETNYRNLALLRPAYQSSAYDYSLTAQLITDGIRDTTPPSWISVSASQKGTLSKDEREWILDHNPSTALNLDGPNVWFQLNLGDGKAPEVDSIQVSGTMVLNEQEAKDWKFTVSGSDDGKLWKELGNASGSLSPGEAIESFWKNAPKKMRSLNFAIHFLKQSKYHFYKVGFNTSNVDRWRIAEVALFKQKARVLIGGPYSFTSAWKSFGNKEEWVYTDLGATCSFDRIVLYWIHHATLGAIQVSDDAATWKDIQALSPSQGLTENHTFEQPVKGRYVRILMKQSASPDGYVLSELEVYGRGGPVANPHPLQTNRNNGRINLAGGNWRIQRESLVNQKGEALSKTGYSDKDWLVATVPATVLMSYMNAGAIPDPNFGDNQVMISESYFYSDFWYRTEFETPANIEGKHVFLNFDGINWKAEIFLNGSKVGNIDGAFMRGKFDVAKLLIAGRKNALTIRIIKNATPGFATEQTKTNPDANGGELGADNPTFHASVGWDWIPTIRGRNIGIWNDVYLTLNGPVTIEDPFVKTDLTLPDTSKAMVSIETKLRNYETKDIKGILHVTFGDAEFEQPVSLKALETKTIRLNPASQPLLCLLNPKLWWPNGYGKQNLYNVELKFIMDDKQTSDVKTFKTGIRKLTYSEDGGVLKIWINGKRFIGRGGNWGFPESNLRYRNREYDAAVRYHKEMNFTLIRNWVGQTGNDEFFEACDSYGIMIWQDFWLANPFDGPDPADPALFISNADDFVRRIRNHPSIVLYCGRNEGNPPQIIDTALRMIISKFHPDLHYISHSSSGGVSGGGPYRAMPVKFYFESRATKKLHSELGMPNIMNYESLKQMMPDSSLWPQGRMWGLHDFCLDGAMAGASFNQMMEDEFGKTDQLREWLTLAQWINYDGYRAMFEAQSKNRMGMLLWMSHPAWPSLVWQTYDYYLEPTAAYFACKKASEPLHIQWNALKDSIEVVNYSSQEGAGITAKLEMINIDGKVILTKDTMINCPEDCMVRCFKMPHPAERPVVFFTRLKLLKNAKVISENFYWHGLTGGNGKAIRELPKVTPEMETKTEHQGNHWYLVTRLKNNSGHPAFMIRLKVVGNKTEGLILPVIYSDNYVSLMPGEQRTINIELEDADTRGEAPKVLMEGVNIK